jgi:Sulfotransferase family
MTALFPRESPAVSNHTPTVIYVMGAGRSGSTIFGVALGNCANVFYAGELEAWLRRSGIPNFPGVGRARFWDVVREDVGGDDLFGDEVWRHLEYSLASFRPSSWARRRRVRHRYRHVLERLYRAISSSAQATHIVDTSHYPLRAREIQRVPGVNLYLIYLIRDPLGVVASFKRRDVTNISKSLLATNAYLSLTHLLSVLVFLRHPVESRLLLRYEDFIANPDSVIRDILSRAGLISSPPDSTSLKTGIAFQGNRLLASDTIALRDNVVSTPHGSYASYLTRLLQLPWTLVLSCLSPKATLSTLK